MIELNARSVDTINQLCKRHSAFALYRLPNSSEDQLCMQDDLSFTQKSDITQLDAAASFIMAPFDPERGGILQIHSERSDLPSPEELDSLPLYYAEENKDANPGYEELFSRYHSLVDSCRCVEKLVLTRSKLISIPLGSSFSPALAYQHACASTDKAFHVLVHSPLTGTWLSSTPELLLAGADDSWQTQALAGTQKKGLIWSDKNIAEHACVVKHLREVLRHAGIDYLESSSETVGTGDIEHLSARFHLLMKQPEFLPLVRALAPTPAVAGYPMQDALRILREHPDTDRQYYTGYLGPYDPAGESALYVCLRCMQIFASSCRLYAGGGIMPDSILEAEWEETEQKMKAMQSIIEQSAGIGG